MRNAVIAIEDRRFYENSGVDLRGHRPRARPGRRPAARRPGRLDDHPAVRQERAARAVRPHGVPEAARGGAGLPPHPQVVQGRRSSRSTSTRSTSATAPTASRPPRARTSAAQHPGCGTARAAAARRVLAPHEAALLAGVIASPSAYDPIAHPAAANGAPQPRPAADARAGPDHRAEDLSTAASEALPAPHDIQPPDGRARRHPYFTTWVRQQLVDRFGARRALRGRPESQTTLDLRPAGRRRRRAIDELPGQPDAAVRGARGDRQRHGRGPRDGRRPRLQRAAVQPRHAGPAPARLGVQALHAGHGARPAASARARSGRRASASSTSPGRRARVFVVNNFEGNYSGVADARRRPDDLRQRGLRRGRPPGRDEADRAHGRAGWASARRSRTNPAMTLGGLRAGRHAARHGPRLRDLRRGRPARHGHARRARAAARSGIRSVRHAGRRRAASSREPRRAARASCGPTWPQTATAAHGQRRGPQGTGRRAALGTEFAAGKTGTTENSGDAWFVGFTKRLHRRRLGRLRRQASSRCRPSSTASPVEGGTFPALIWHDFMVTADALATDQARADRERAQEGLPPLPDTTTTPPPPTTPVPAERARARDGAAGRRPARHRWHRRRRRGRAGDGRGTTPATPKRRPRRRPRRPTPAPATPRPRPRPRRRRRPAAAGRAPAAPHRAGGLGARPRRRPGERRGPAPPVRPPATPRSRGRPRPRHAAAAQRAEAPRAGPPRA